MRIIYIDCDSLRPDHLGCYGYERDTSPSIDRIAAEGMRFENCFVSDAPCLPSRTALWAGRCGMRNGVVGHAGTPAKMRYPGDAHGTDPRKQPVPMALSRAGVHTTTISTFGQRHLAWHFYAGWDEIQKFSNLGGNELAVDVEAAATRWLRQNADREDVLVHINFWDPHTPYRTPAEYGNPFADAPVPAWPTQDVLDAQWETYGPLGARDICSVAGASLRTPAEIRTPDDLKIWIDGYDTGIRYMDDSIGRLFHVLTEIGWWDECAIIISADHGENQGELNLYGAHLSADKMTCNVPMIVRWPGVTPAGTSSALVHQLDLGPTIMDLLGHPIPEFWDGRSFAPALRGEDFTGRDYVVFGQGAWFAQRGVVQDGWLYMRTSNPALDPMPDELLFNLSTDPHEERNLAGSDSAKLAHMRGLLAEWWHATNEGWDPMLEVARQGGYYPRQWKGNYLKHLRNTGRAHFADELETRRVLPIVNPEDMSRP